MTDQYIDVTVELTDSEWMSLIDAERHDGLQRCCGNISDLRDYLIMGARNGGTFDMFTVEQLRYKIGAALDGHVLDGIPALDKVRAAMDLAGKPPHVPQPGPEKL